MQTEHLAACSTPCCHDLVRILSLAGLVRENSSLAVSADLPVTESERWPLAAFIMTANSSTKNIIMADDEFTQTVGPKGGKSCKRSNRAYGHRTKAEPETYRA